MFKLVGSEPFEILEGQAKCEILINASSGFSYDYTLLVDGKQLTKFKEIRGKVMKTWLLQVNGQTYRIVLGNLLLFASSKFYNFSLILGRDTEKDSLDIWVNGKKIESNNEFDEDGTAISFGLNDSEDACIKTISSGNKKEGIIYSLIVNGSEVPESLE